jgi:hypothetical protein
MRLRSLVFALPFAALAAGAGPRAALACGGYFEPLSARTIVSAHRMAFSITPQQTVLWDQIRYSGDPSEFAWVLPVRAGARLELSRDEWFAALDASTQPVVTYPGSGVACSVAGCASQGGPAQGTGGNVRVLARATVGPYEMATLRSKDPNALVGWLTTNGYDLPASVRPIVEAYVGEGFDFIALRLRPECGEQSMVPVRVITQGADPTLPLRMVAAGVGANVDIVLYVIGEGRWRPQNFPEALVDDGQLTLDEATGGSNYEAVAQQLMAQNGGTTWLTEGSGVADLSGWRPGVAPLASAGSNPGLAPAYFALCNGASAVPGTGVPVVAPTPCPQEAGADVGAHDGEAGDAQASDAEAGDAEASDAEAGDAQASDAEAGDAQASDAEAGDAQARDAEAGDAQASDAATGACAAFDDLDVAVGRAPASDVWVTRLRARLPVEALATDLRLEASPTQSAVSPEHTLSPGGLTDSGSKGCAAARRPRDAFGAALLVGLTAFALGVILRRARSS